MPKRSYKLIIKASLGLLVFLASASALIWFIVDYQNLKERIYVVCRHVEAISAESHLESVEMARAVCLTYGL